MNRRPLTFHVYPAADGWRWRAIVSGRIMADSGEAYASERNARRAVTRLLELMPTAQVDPAARVHSL